MLQAISDVNWLAVSAAFFAYFFLGPLWYMGLFSRAYKISLGIDPSAAPDKNPIYIVGPAICSLLVTITTAILSQALHVTALSEALPLALVVGTGYLVANTFNIAINPNIPKPLFYGLISGAFNIVGILVVTIILTALN